MKKWINLGLGLFVLAGIAISILLYFSIQPYKDKEELAFSAALEKSSLKTAEEFDWFRYKEEYFIVTGKNQAGEETIVWMDAENLTVVAEYQASEGISKEEVLQSFQDEWDISEVIDIKLGYADKRPLWELTFIDKNNRYTFLQVSFLTGDWIRYYQYSQGGVSS
ncbi:MAG TPA: DUF5590 domain-containing protein [Bacillus sp. (in: firmicutes)]|uniref:cell wall elongation regulator TseB-like domain-containing protein n=1 Tax=Bacillus litorisediminis TaxID=2922713 RepID=UPI001FAD4BA2|nr:DUF5590 domain-containing protein [Bacillus litorisediminis]HWO76365.1 DUF5590 domain-containing protein [Bacillus sp. (in: firmicutes)]